MKPTTNTQDEARARVYDAATTNDTRAPRSPFVRRMLLTVATVTAVGLGLIFMWYAVEVLLLVFAGILLATVLRALADLLAGYTPLSSGWALLIVLLALVGGLGVGGWLLAPPISAQVDELAQALPQSVGQVEQWLEQFPWGRELLNLQPGTNDFLADYGGTVVTRATGFLSTSLGIVVETLVVLFLGIYLAVNPGKYVNGAVRLVPMAKRARAREVFGAVGYTLKWFLLGRLLAMIVVGIITTAGLLLLGVPLALVFGIITTLLTFVPYVGPIVSAILPALVALTVSPTLALWVLLLYLVVQNVEGYLLTPLLLQGTVSVPPALTIIAELLFGLLFGVLGIILATPFIAVAVILVKLVYIEDVLGDKSTQTDEQSTQAQPT